MKRTVHDFLDQSRGAQALASLNLGQGRRTALWVNQRDRISYEAPKGHTFSFYLAGGTGTRRLDQGGRRGRPGSVCVMPEGAGSEWEITHPFRFVHLYLSDEALRSAYARIFDYDARRLELHDETFVSRPELARPLAALAKATEMGEVLAADAAIADLIAALPDTPADVSGGLAPWLLRRMDDWIEAHLDQPIRLAELAQLADLSEFHLHRMFRASRGTTPQDWITGRRIARAKQQLCTSTPLAQIAAETGFSSQSHLTRRFRRATGVTPGSWRILSQENKHTRH